MTSKISEIPEEVFDWIVQTVDDYHGWKTPALIYTGSRYYRDTEMLRHAIEELVERGKLRYTGNLRLVLGEDTSEFRSLSMPLCRLHEWVHVQLGMPYGWRDARVVGHHPTDKDLVLVELDAEDALATGERTLLIHRDSLRCQPLFG